MQLSKSPFLLGRSLTILALVATLMPIAWAAPKYKVLYSFTGGDNGAYPNGPLLEDKLGNFYGATYEGGSSGWGTVFELTQTAKRGAWILTTLYAFTGGNDGGIPASGLIFDKYGNLYGTTFLGGKFGDGAIFQLRPPATPGDTWKETAIYSFTSVVSTPSGPAIDEQGNLYGTTEYDGSFGNGTVFRLAPPVRQSGTWTETVLYQFRGVPDGAVPKAPVTVGKNGVLYGATDQGGRGQCYGGEGYIVGCGTVFQLKPPAGHRRTWAETVLYSFTGGVDGLNPDSHLIFDKTGALYGTDGNTAFRLEPQPRRGRWVESTLYTFRGGISGTGPIAGLVLDQAGRLYGTTNPTGTLGYGTVFELIPPIRKGGGWKEKTLHTFRGYSANQPSGDLTLSKGALYGVAENVGDYRYGTVFEIVPD